MKSAEGTPADVMICNVARTFTSDRRLVAVTRNLGHGHVKWPHSVFCTTHSAAQGTKELKDACNGRSELLMQSKPSATLVLVV